MSDACNAVIRFGVYFFCVFLFVNLYIGSPIKLAMKLRIECCDTGVALQRHATNVCTRLVGVSLDKLERTVLHPGETHYELWRGLIADCHSMKKWGASWGCVIAEYQDTTKLDGLKPFPAHDGDPTVASSEEPGRARQLFNRVNVHVESE